MYQNTDETKTLDRLTKAMQRQHPVTLSYIRSDGEHVLRTIEIYEVPDELTKAGKRIVRAIDRETGETRTWRVDRIQRFTVHRSSYRVERCPEHHTGIQHCHTYGQPHFLIQPGNWCDEHEMTTDYCLDWTHQVNIYNVT